MIKVIREVSADVVKRGTTKAVYAKQNDRNSRFLNVRIQEDGKDIKVSPTSKVMLNVERPDKQENIFYGTVNEDGTVNVPMTSWMLELEGTLLCDVSIVVEGDALAKLTTMQFNIYVESAVVSDESFMETEEYSIIMDLLARTEEAGEIAERAAASVIGCDEAAARANDAAEAAEKVDEAIQGMHDELDSLRSGIESIQTPWAIYETTGTGYMIGQSFTNTNVENFINKFETFIIRVTYNAQGRTRCIMACRTLPDTVLDSVSKSPGTLVAAIEGSVSIMDVQTSISHNAHVRLGIHSDNYIEVLASNFTDITYTDGAPNVVKVFANVTGIYGVCGRIERG